MNFTLTNIPCKSTYGCTYMTHQIQIISKQVLWIHIVKWVKRFYILFSQNWKYEMWQTIYCCDTTLHDEKLCIWIYFIYLLDHKYGDLIEENSVPKNWVPKQIKIFKWQNIFYSGWDSSKL